MTREVERQLMRLLHGELPEAEAQDWRRRVQDEPDIAEVYGTLDREWSALEMPEPLEAGTNLVASVWRRLDEERQSSVLALWRLASVGRRVTAAAALAVGLGLGVVAGSGPVTIETESLLGQAETTLAESYWLAVEVDEAAGLGEVER